MNRKHLVIIGAGGHAVSVSNVARSAGFEVKYFVDERLEGKKLHGVKIIKYAKELAYENFNFAISVGDNFSRARIYNKMCGELALEKFPSLIHKSAVISDLSTVGFGSVVMPNSTVGPNSKLGIFCILNTNSSIDHDCTMADFSSLAPASNTGGNVTIGERSAVSIGAKIKNGVNIGNDAVIGANSYVNTPIPSNCVSYGNPAKIVRKRKPGDPYLD